MWKKIVYSIYAFIVLILVVFSAVQTYRLGKNRRELEQVRKQLEYARNRTSDIRETFERYNERTRGIFSESISTISELRTQISEVREVYEDMADYINSLDSDICHINNSTSSCDKE